MKAHNKYAIIGLKALKRAAAKVADEARKNNYKIPFWINGHIEYEIPGITPEHQRGAVKQDHSNSFEKKRQH